MRNFILGFLLSAILVSGGFLAYTRGYLSPGGGQAETAQKYHCPMHPTYISDKQGDCPICGMRLVPIKSDSGQKQQQAEKAEKYHCPMHPTYISDKPGDCPICGMKLVPMKTAAQGDASGPPGEGSKVPGYETVTIPTERQQLMGIITTPVERVSLEQSIRTTGRVTYDERKLHHVHTKFEGFIEELYVNYVGQQVKQGQKLFSIYSPELYATQQEYLLALRARSNTPMLRPETGARQIDLVAAARQRLALWDISEADLREVERTGQPIRALNIYSHVTGVVTGKQAVMGLKVMPGDNLYDIADLSSVWVLADLYETTLPNVRVGQPATVSLTYSPGGKWRGKVAFIDPVLDPATRTLKARLEVDNPGGRLKPEMFTDVEIGGTRGSGLAVPENAVIATGERNIVFVSKGDGVFEPREVVPGIRVRNMWQILSGLSQGERVVTGANFLLDSESKLKAAVSGNSGNPHGS